VHGLKLEIAEARSDSMRWRELHRIATTPKRDSSPTSRIAYPHTADPAAALAVTTSPIAQAPAAPHIAMPASRSPSGTGPTALTVPASGQPPAEVLKGDGHTLSGRAGGSGNTPAVQRYRACKPALVGAMLALLACRAAVQCFRAEASPTDFQGMLTQRAAGLVDAALASGRKLIFS
jgi:hypothetical protein